MMPGSAMSVKAIDQMYFSKLHALSAHFDSALTSFEVPQLHA